LSTAWLDELPLDPLAGWPAMGVHADHHPWPEPGDPAVLAHRRHLLQAHPESVAVLAEGIGAALECAGAVGVLAPEATAGSDREAARDALAAAAVDQADDLCLLAPEPGWPLVAGALLFPSHWRLEEKLGRPVSEIHDRVPGYPAAQVGRFLDRLGPGHVAWRRNLLVHRDGTLHSPWPSTTDVPVEQWWLRSERQTLRLLPETGAVLFTIRSDTAPLAHLDIALRRRLAARFEALPHEWRDYAGVGGRLGELVASLRRH
jgi:hypothetical protein